MMENKYLTNLDNLSLADCLYRSLSRYITIVIINNEDFKQLDLDDFTTDYFFIVNEPVPSGQSYIIEDTDLKMYFLKSCIEDEENLDNVFRGRKIK